MKKVTMNLLLAFFTIGSILSLVVIFTVSEKDIQFSSEAHADWPEYEINRLIERADLVVIGQAKKLKKFKETKFEGNTLDRQYSQMEISKVIKGQVENEVMLNQAINHLEKNKKYLLFLKKGEDGNYYELTDKAVIPYENGKFTFDLVDFKEEFKEDEVISTINILNESIKAKNSNQ